MLAATAQRSGLQDTEQEDAQGCWAETAMWHLMPWGSGLRLISERFHDHWLHGWQLHGVA